MHVLTPAVVVDSLPYETMMPVESDHRVRHDVDVHVHDRAASRLTLLGPPGGGKGTHAGKLAQKIGVPHIATGDMLRDEVARGTDLGQQVKSVMDAGHLVRDDLVTEIALRRLSRPDAGNGWILDGYPRTLHQARDLDDHVKDERVDLVLVLEVPDEEVFTRIAGRRTCPKGHVYHVDRNPPRTPGICDVDGLPLERREDAAEEVIRDRLEVYRRESPPLLDFYDAGGILRRVDGTGTLDTVFERLVATLGRARR